MTDHLSSKIEIEDSSDDELVQDVVHEMKDVLNGISAFNPLGGHGQQKSFTNTHRFNCK